MVRWLLQIRHKLAGKYCLLHVHGYSHKDCGCRELETAKG